MSTRFLKFMLYSQTVTGFFSSRVYRGLININPLVRAINAAVLLLLLPALAVAGHARRLIVIRWHWSTHVH